MSSTKKLRPNPLSENVNYCARRLVETAEELSKPMEPLGKSKIGPQKQLERYEQMRHDPRAWLKLLQQRGPVETLAYVEEMERLRARHEARELTRAERARWTEDGEEEPEADDDEQTAGEDVDGAGVPRLG